MPRKTSQRLVETMDDMNQLAEKAKTKIKVNAEMREKILKLKDGDTFEIPLRYLQKVDNCREEIDYDSKEFLALKKSIEKVGLIHYPTVGFHNDHLFIITGHRRIEACKFIAGSKKEIENDESTITVTLKMSVKQRDNLMYQLFENNNRKNLEPIEYCESVAKFMRDVKLDYKTCAEYLGRNRKYPEQYAMIANWPRRVKNFAKQRGTPMTVLRAIAADKDLRSEEKLIEAIRSGSKSTVKPKTTRTFKIPPEKTTEWRDWCKSEKLDTETRRTFVQIAKLLFPLQKTNKQRFKKFMRILELN